MNSLEGTRIIYALKRKWQLLSFLKGLMLLLAIIALIGSVALTVGMRLIFVVPAAVIAMAIIFFYNRFWKILPEDVSSYLDQHFNQLEDSSALLLKPSEELSGLSLLQQQKVDQRLASIKLPFYPGKGIGQVGVVLLISLTISAMCLFIKPVSKVQEVLTPSKALAEQPVKEKIPVQIETFSLQITPPAYTRVASRNQKQFYVKAEVGSKVNWIIKTNQSIKECYLVFDGKTRVKLKATKGDGIEWSSSKVISTPGFYQIELGGNKSDLYQIDVMPDLPVEIKISNPKQHSSIDIGQPASVNLKLKLTDDYGITDAYITATMASGKGEGVIFTEKKLPFNLSFNNKRSVAITKLIDLKSLGMKPGDELYFFVNAKDNLGQNSRSDMYFVSIVDTTELMSMAGMTSGVNLVPEYFRSQRQIIIDTEKLLKEKSGISDKEFKDKSNDIGVDQKLLRLRYGKFLGEESETEIGADHDHKDGDEDHDAKGNGEEKFGDVKEIMDQYAHKHDIAEDATFFEPELKAQLKAVLTEMWGSELRLRTYKPQEALPFEYKALRLLKDLQQKSRAYVAKTTVKTAQLKAEKRLSGELDKISSTVQKEQFKNTDSRVAEIRTALTVLEGVKARKKISDNEASYLRSIEKYLLSAATNRPGVYLPGLKSLRKLSATQIFNRDDVDVAGSAFKRLVPAQNNKPLNSLAEPENNLSKSYFKNLNSSVR